MLGAAMKHFASTDTFLENSDWNFRMGRPLANEAFLRGLMQYGNFDSYTFFVPDAAAAAAWEQKFARLVPDPQQRARATAQPHLSLRQVLRRQPFDIMHQGDFTYFLPHLCGLRHSLEVPPWPLSGVTHSLDGLQTRFLQLALCHLAPYDAIVCTSRAAQAVVRHKLAEVSGLLQDRGLTLSASPVQTPIIALGLDDAAFVAADAGGARQAARRALRLPGDAKVILSVGRLSLRGKADWAPIFELLHDMHSAGLLHNVVWLVAGGSTPQSLELLQALVQTYALSSVIRLVPNFSPRHRAQLYAAADIYASLVDNLQETFGLSIVEAMAAGLPVLASDYDGYRDTVCDNETGILVPTIGLPSSPSCMQDTLGLLDPSVCRLLAGQMTAVSLPHVYRGLLALLNDADLRGRLGAAGRRRAQRHRFEAVIAAYEALWQQQADLAQQTAKAPKRGSTALLGGTDLRAYDGYVAHMLTAQSLLCVGPRGAMLLQDPNASTRYQDIAPLLNLAVEQALLQAVTQGPTSVQKLRLLGCQAGAISVQDVDFQLGWLLKHGALHWVDGAI